jgi:hypothetical protein
MDERVRNFISAFFGPELHGQWADLKASVLARPAYRETIRDGLAEILRTRPFNVDDWRRLTYADVATDDEVYAEVAKGYRFLFPDDGAS